MAEMVVETEAQIEQIGFAPNRQPHLILSLSLNSSHGLKCSNDN